MPTPEEVEAEEKKINTFCEQLFKWLGLNLDGQR